MKKIWKLIKKNNIIEENKIIDKKYKRDNINKILIQILSDITNKSVNIYYNSKNKIEDSKNKIQNSNESFKNDNELILIKIYLSLILGNQNINIEKKQIIKINLFVKKNFHLII